MRRTACAGGVRCDRRSDGLVGPPAAFRTLREVAMPSIPPIVVARDTHASPAESWAAIVEPERVALWFATVTPAGPVGSPYRIDFGDSAVEGVVLVERDPLVQMAQELGEDALALLDRFVFDDGIDDC